MLLLFITIFYLTGYSSDNFTLILSYITLCIFFLYFSLCHLGNGHLDLGHHSGVPKSYRSLGAQSHLENTLCHLGNGHLDLGHHLGVSKSYHSLGAQSHLENNTLTWSIHSLGAYSHLENFLTWRTYLTWRTVMTIKCWLLHNKVSS